ncbi:polyprenyl synthetase family protein [Actinomyces culturomici]|uniref:polyprenyl synthetase family protein n=1 Tax=Actinomyces culturomici TaxID=1926276 RepID=UPI000E20C37A|nr:polyprenyl synthetase family protein [Actinomyces culturomici]
MTVSAPDLHVPDLESRILPGLEVVERRLRESVVGSRDLTDELTSHLAAAGGKRLRPLLTLVCAQLGDPEMALSDDVITGAAAVELTHLASLYHDDVMDSAPTRRGVPSAQHLWGNNRAILAGDVLFARASSLIAGLGPEMVAYHARTFERLCIGQLNETFGPAAGDDRVQYYLQVLADKTGSLVATAAHFGAVLSHAGDEVAAIVSEFGEKIGVAFQIADDVLDLASTGDKSGKTPGTDLREGVDTLPVLLLRRRELEGTIDEAGARILAALDADLSSDEALARVVESLRAHDVLVETRELARTWADDAIAILDPLPEGEPKTGLVAFAHLMVDRLA